MLEQVLGVLNPQMQQELVRRSAEAVVEDLRKPGPSPSSDARAFRGTFDLGREAHFNNAGLVFSRASSEPNRDHPLWDRRRIATSCWDLLANGAIDCERIVDPVVTFDEAPRANEAYVDRNPQHSVNVGVTSI